MFDDVVLEGVGITLRRFAFFKLPKLSMLSVLILVKVLRFSASTGRSSLIGSKVGIDPVFKPKYRFS